MRLAILVCGLMAMGGCVQKKPTAVSAPPAPAPPVAKKVTAPFSYPQTVVKLPGYQPLPEDALPAEPAAPAAEAARVEPAPAKPKAIPPPVITSPKRVPESLAGIPEPLPGPAPAPAEAPAGQKLVEAGTPVPSENELRLKLDKVKKSLSDAERQTLTFEQRSELRRANAFVSQSAEALGRGDLQEAAELCDRATALGRFLTRAR